MGLFSSHKFTISCLKGPDRKRKWRFDTHTHSTIVIGRIDGCHVQLKDTRVSESHCMICFLQERFYIVDLGSRYGTILNNRRIKGLTPLSKESQLQLGKSYLQIILPALNNRSAPVLTGQKIELFSTSIQHTNPFILPVSTTKDQNIEPTELGQDIEPTAENSLIFEDETKENLAENIQPPNIFTILSGGANLPSTTASGGANLPSTTASGGENLPSTTASGGEKQSTSDL